MEYKVLAYYLIGKIEDPQAEVARQHEFFRSRDFKGRIYISEEGINGQASGLAAHADEYMAWMRADPRFEKMPFKLHPAHEHAFAKMTVKYRKQLVAIDCPVDFSQRGEAISPDEWKKKLEERDDQTLVLDVRNDYEWEVGHFDGAELPPLEAFREFPAYAEQLKKEKDPKTTAVLMYCTGGIRCEYYSALMKQAGFEKVYQLDGGVIGYGLEKGSEHWKGNLFVFDDRLVVPLGEKKEAPISYCKYCETPIDVYYNCANMDCNELFLSCPDCLKGHKGCCCTDCSSAPRVRPFREEGSSKPFRKWNAEEKRAWSAQNANAPV
jgi:UPF0176 protein